MKKEEVFKDYILQHYKSIREFCKKADIPYSTLDNLFKRERGLDGCGSGVVVKICRELNIDVDRLIEDGVIVDKPINDLSDEERALVLAYRAKPELHQAVDKLLDL